MCGYDTHRLADVYGLTVCKVYAVTLGAYAVLALTGEYRATVHSLYACLDNSVSDVVCNKLVSVADHISCLGVKYRL